ncbi:hypothetical protein CLV62_12085 [Dysgonomonas alginatilytica]|uniref:DoxX-like protein n=2 Tax=Dysgonomonas alginatilytica TaxID=1605892 RepID=A0A2V3PM11_9BACT|nr:hypothetical protein CLV62_12085 [Dysgonomonas alginatilytica]
MLPDFIPCKTEVVYLTGIIEIVAAIGLLIPDFRIIVAWLLIAFILTDRSCMTVGNTCF